MLKILLKLLSPGQAKVPRLYPWPDFSQIGDGPMAVDPTALRTEINTDPAGLGYAAAIAAGADNQLQALLNQRISGNKINLGYISSDQLPTLIVGSEYTAITQAQRDYLQLLMSAPLLRFNDTNVRNALGTIFGAATTTRANIIAAQQRDGSRAESLFGAGVIISDSDISAARGSGW